ncbi:glycosyltransferase family 4 protein [Thioclava sp. BHET1]|nr:glycosyltransferase family 4 protein [Thioclava sp. BHET1]
MRGGEKVLESLCRMFPQADIFTHVYLPDRISPLIRAHRVETTRIGRLPMAGRLYQKYLPLMPRALEELDLSGYDLVISSEAGPAKGVIAPPDAPHLCYCHSPMRYLWDQYHTYRDGAGLLTRALMPHLAHRLRHWDVSSAARVDGFAANSSHVADRIRKYWRREAAIVHPPVAVTQFSPAAAQDVEDFYLWAGELAPYKRPDIAIDAFRLSGRRLVIAGGPEKARSALAERARGQDNITFAGRVSDAELRRLMARCRALIFPGEEDFGIIPVEVMASGRPVIAYGRGGALDTVIDGQTGLLFHEQTAEGLADAIERFEARGLHRLDPGPLVTHAARFDEAAFRQGIVRSLHAIGAPLAEALDKPARIAAS